MIIVCVQELGKYVEQELGLDVCKLICLWNWFHILSKTLI